MLYTASYFQPETHHGKLISISASQPAQFKKLPTLNFFAPTWKLVEQWKNSKKTPKDWHDYQDHFYHLVDERWNQIEDWFGDRTFLEENITLLCWEKPKDYCHRNDVGALIAANLPYLWGGGDVQLTQLEKKLIKCRKKGFQISCYQQKFSKEQFSFYIIFLNGREVGNFTEIGALNVCTQISDPTYSQHWFESRNLDIKEIKGILASHV